MDGILDDLEKWCRKIPPDPRHARKLVLVEIDTLEGFEAHARAFTRVKNLQCNFLLLPSVVECLAPAGSSVILLDFDDSETTSSPYLLSSPGFGELEIDITYFMHKATLIDQWLSGSCTSLTSLAIYGDPDSEF